MKEIYYDLTNPQKNIWDLESFYKSTNINNIYNTIVFNEKIDENLLKQAIYDLVKNNISFHIHITIIDNIPKQYFSDYNDFEIPIINVKNKEHLKEIQSKIIDEKFDILNSNLFKFYIIKFDNGCGALISNIHHLIADSWSLGLTIKLILKNYNKLLNNEEYELPTTSYLDFINSEKEYINNNKCKSDQEYWSNLFKTIPDLVSLPTSMDSKTSYSCDANRKSFIITEKKVNSIKEFVKDNNTSMFNFFMSVYAIYTSRVTNSNSFVIGTPILNRLNFNEKNCTGMFVNTIPVLFNIDQSITFKNFINEFSKDMFKNLRHQRYSYSQILSDLRSNNHNVPNLFNTIISYQITNAVDSSLIDYKTEWLFNNKCGNDFNIHIMDTNNTGNLYINYDYLSDKYTESDIIQFHTCILNIINQIINIPDISLNKIELLSESEKQKMLNSVNEPFNDEFKDKNLIEIFKEQVLKNPNKTSLTFNNNSITYKQLDNYSNSLANHLIKNGINKEETIAIYMDKSIEMVIAMMAIIKAGANYLAIDTSFPQERINFMLNDSSSKLLLYIDEKQKLNISYEIDMLNVSLNSFNYLENTNNPNINVSRNNLIYTMYTSGSTGKPKGVMIEETGIIRLVKNPNFITFEENDVMLQTSAIVFDSSTLEIWGALLNGLTLSIITKEHLLNPKILKKHIIDNHITIIWLTTPLFNILSEQDPSVFNTCKYILVGGDVLSPKHINRVINSNPNLNIINGYGPTENTTFSCCFPIDKEYSNSNSIPIGKAVTNSTCYVVSNVGTLQPYNVPGELWVGGEGVARGYLNRDDLSKERFIDDYFLGHGKMYKTGDLVKINYNNQIEFIGRMDNQVKIHGIRIELDEINLKILSFKEIKESYTTVLDINNDKKICSFIVFKNENKEEELIDYLRKKLALYMIPSHFEVLDSLPLNANGKVDKKALPQIKIKEGTNNIKNPSTDSEKYLVKEISSLLNSKTISIDSTFFNIGLDSLSAIRLAAKIYNDKHIDVTIKDIFNFNTIEKLAKYIDTKNNGKNNASKKQFINKVEKQEFYPLSTAQKRIYFASKMIGESNLVYNLPGAILIDGILNKEKVQKCFKTIIDNQNIFKTSFVEHDNDIYQKISDNVDFSINTYNSKFENIEEIKKSFSKPFDLSKAPLLRVELHYFKNNKTLLLIESHHIVMDGVSFNILLNDFKNLYTDNNLVKTDYQYIDYTNYEREYLNGETLKEDEKYWISRFKDFNFESLNLPYDYTLPSKRTYVGNKIFTNIDNKLIKQVNELSKNYSLSTYSVFLTAFYITLYLYTGQNDIVVGSPCSNRTLLETHSIIGMFVNNLCLRLKILPNQEVLELFKYVQKQISDDLVHQSYPYDLLVKKLEIPNDFSRNPIFDVVFAYQNQSNDFSLNNKMHLSEINNNTSKFNMTFEIDPVNEHLNVEYRTDLFKENTIISFIEHYKYILEQITSNINMSVSNIKIITPQEQLKLDEFNNTNSEIIKKTAIELFEDVVRKQPNSIALICNDKTLTYKELNEKANSLAHLLVNKGVKANDVIAIITNRSLETIVCMLAILKAGGAFLNIDPTYPIERTKYYIENSNIKLTLIHKELHNKFSDLEDCIDIDLDINSIYSINKENLGIHSNDSDLSYLIYTSGSTGKPKGVMLNQLGLSNMVQAMTKVLKYLKEGNKHTIVSVTSTPFDIFVYEIMVPITHGMKIVMATNAEHRNPKLLDKLIRKYNVDVMTVTPSLMKINYDNKEPNTALSLVKNMVFGGEPLPEKFVKDLRALADDIKIYNIYGPSEITVLSNVQDLDGENEITVGPPIMNTHIHILNSDMKELPIGVTGEIYISGIQVGDGYIGREDLTNERFLPNPFGSGKIYKSGDIGRWTFDGKIQCLGRIDNQIKLRGLRIELGEIEDIISNIPGVISSIVNKVTINEKEALCAYYVCKEKVFENTIREKLKEKLPPYMVPTYLMELESMPYTINRKIDRKALPLPQLYTSNSNKEIDINELSSTEEKLMQIWKNILGIQDITTTDNFFDIGGDSISAIKMQIEALKYGLDFEYADIFNYPTINQLSKKLPSPAEDFISNYDYSLVNNILERNNINNLDTIKKYNFKNVLLLGVTGYLGAHILYEFLKNETGNIYCLVRQKNNQTIAERIKSTLAFYFGSDYYENNKDRIKIIEGEIAQKRFGLNKSALEEVKNNVDCVINSAALVKHFGLKDEFYSINVTGTNNVIDFCKENNFRLIHISTISVSGFGEKEEIPEVESEEGSKTFAENNLFINQNIKGYYSITKYEAELAVLNAINNGLNAQILRMGNITNRYNDGIFQINYNDNAFVRRLKSFIEIGAIPNDLIKHSIELTPVDFSSQAIIKILEYESDCNVFHIYNPNLIPIQKVVNILQNIGFNIQIVTPQLMSMILSGILSDDSKKEMISGIIQDIDNNKKLVYTSNIRLISDFSNKYLNKIGFKWPIYDDSYIKKCIEYYKKIGFIK